MVPLVQVVHLPWVPCTFFLNIEVHLLVKNLSPGHGYLRQWLICQTRWKKNIKDNEKKKKEPQDGILWRSSFLYEDLKLPKTLDLLRTPLAKKCLLILSSMLGDLHWRSLDHSVKSGQGQNPFGSHSLKILDCSALLHCSLSASPVFRKVVDSTIW